MYFVVQEHASKVEINCSIKVSLSKKVLNKIGTRENAANDFVRLALWVVIYLSLTKGIKL